jgi:hypothetical protein
MNGYRAMVERRRRRLAEAAGSGERAAVPDFDWLVAVVDAVADAAHVPNRRGDAPRPAKPADQPPTQPEPTGDA